jgi:anaerobic dimethyl sulfoxide reductase subunit A
VSGGRVEVEAFPTEDIIPGCVALIQGVWSVRDSQGVERGGAASVLTSTAPTLPSQGSRTHLVFVEVGLRAAEK